MKYLITTFIGIIFLFFACKKQEPNSKFPYKSVEISSESFNVNSYGKIIIKDLEKQEYLSKDLTIEIDTPGGFFNKNNKNILNLEIIKGSIEIPFKVSNIPGNYQIKISIKNNDFIETIIKDFEIIKPNPILQNASLSEIEISADNSSQITISLNNDTFSGQEVIFEIDTTNKGKCKFVNIKHIIRRTISSNNFTETFIVSDMPGNYVVKIYEKESTNGYKSFGAKYLPFTLTGPTTPPEIYTSTTFSSLTDPFIADSNSIAEVSFNVDNLAENQTENVKMTIINSDATFLSNNSNVFIGNVNNVSSSITKTMLVGKRAGIIALDIEFMGDTIHKELEVKQSFPSYLLVNPNTNQIQSAANSTTSGSIYYYKTIGRVSEGIPIILKAYQGAIEVGSFTNVFLNTTSNNKIDFSFTSNALLDTNQTLDIVAQSFNQNSMPISASVSVVVLP